MLKRKNDCIYTNIYFDGTTEWSLSGIKQRGIAFGLDRFVSIMAGLDTIRDCIAFPKNNSGRDVMLDAPAALDPTQLDELKLIVKSSN